MEGTEGTTEMEVGEVEKQVEWEADKWMKNVISFWLFGISAVISL